MKPNQAPKIKVDPESFSPQQVFTTGQCDCDCDCACAQAFAAPASPLHSGSEILSQMPGVMSLDVGDDFSLVINPVVSRPALYNAKAREILALFNGIKTTEQIATDRPSINREIVHRIAEQSVALGILGNATDSAGTRVDVTQSKILTAWLHITNDCNLACEYCYIKKTGLRMTETVGLQALDKVFSASRQNGYQAVKLKYAGGEPTLNFRVVEELSNRARQLAVEYNVRVEEVVLSNGIAISPHMLNFIRANKIRLMISLDELGTDVVGQRPTRGGIDTSTRVQQSIEHCLEAGIKPDISITIAHQSVASLTQLVAWLLARELPFSLNFFRPSDNSGLEEDWLADPARMVGAMQSVYALIAQNIPRHTLLAALLDRANLAFPHVTPCQAGRDYLVIDPMGNISKCQMDMDHPVGNILTSNDPLALVRESPLGVDNISVEEKAECAGCAWNLWCAGGCPLEAGQAGSRSMAKTAKCKIYHALMPEVLQLEGLRLLKHGTDILN